MESWIIGEASPIVVRDRLLQMIEQCSSPVVCFDYFDTLVVRDIQAEFTKQLAARLHVQFFDCLCSPEKLYSIRQNIEKELCQENAEGGGELEFYLNDFAARYYQILRSENIASLDFLSEDVFTQNISGIETAVELSVQRRCQESVEVLKMLKERGIKTVLISDFYLSSPYFKKFLDHFQFLDLFDHIYISSDHKLAKGSGRLYKRVCEELSCTPQQLIMIGDNLHSDVAMAIDFGARAVHIRNPEREAFYSGWQPSVLDNAKTCALQFSSALPVNGTFPEMSSTLWLFTKRLFDKLVRTKTEDVFFFSKEGEFLKKLFDLFQEQVYGTVRIRSHYILVSRKATFLASLRPLVLEDFSRLFSHYRDISLRDFLLSLNIEESVASSICNELDLDFQSRIADLQNSPQFEKLKKSSVFQTEYERRRVQQRENFIDYLDSFNIDYKRKGMTIVDVGWKGSIQDNVYHILEGLVPIQGFFLGSLIATEKCENNRKNGLLFDDFPEPTLFFHVYNNNRSLFEMLLGASHGSADGYFTREQYDRLPGGHQRIVQKLISSSGREICVTTLDFPEERQLFKERIQPLQAAILKSAVLMNKAFILTGCQAPKSEWFARQHARMVFKPSKLEVDFFEQLYHLENFGIFEYTNFLAGDSLSTRQRLRNLKNVIRDPAILESGFWPPIILKRLGIALYRHVDGWKRFRKQFGSGKKLP